MSGALKRIDEKMINIEGLLSTKSITLVADISKKQGYLECLLEGAEDEQVSVTDAARKKKFNASVGMNLNVSQLNDVSMSEAYELQSEWLLGSCMSMRDAHRHVFAVASPEAGSYRAAGMGIYQQNKLVHTTAPSGQIDKQLRQLLTWVENADEHPLVKAAVFLRQYEFIQPFSVGNCCIGHLWVSLILETWHDLLRWLNFEGKLKERRSEYYECLRQSIGNNDLNVMVEFVLCCINDALNELLNAIKNQLSRQEAEGASVKGSELSSGNGSVNPALKGIRPYFTTRENIIALLQEHPEWSAMRLSDALGISDRAVEKHIAILKSRGQLKRVGSARGGYWRVVGLLNEQLGLLGRE